MFAFSQLEAARVATEMSYFAAERPQNDVQKLKLRNMWYYMLAFSKLIAARVATEMSCYTAKPPQNDVDKLTLQNPVRTPKHNNCDFEASFNIF